MGFCEDSAKAGILYSEVRYAPHLMTGDSLTPGQVVEAVSRGLEKGSAEFGIMMRSILCCMRHVPAWNMEVVDLCVKYRDLGVVGIDLAGDEINFPNKEHIPAFQAIELMCAERIGHGYHTIDDPAILQLAKDKGTHFEIC